MKLIGKFQCACVFLLENKKQQKPLKSLCLFLVLITLVIRNCRETKRIWLSWMSSLLRLNFEPM